ncbi:DUF885 domain-containing protein [Ascidiimonas sp. W6]|uniref:DUF885 domain-containing protein n=1 Tax=Ascidiimonas meishanensis TaxID=3128903 RepID=UPI0030ED6A31
MKIRLISIFVFVLILTSCKEAPQVEVTEVKLPSLQEVLSNYHEASLKLNPLNATYSGDTRYNDQLPIDISENHKTKVWVFNMRYRDTLEMYPDQNLTEEQLMSKAVLNWEIEQALNRHKFSSELIPINQMFSLPLTIGQLGSGSGAQPFNNHPDYMNWLARLERFASWCDTAVVNMKKGVDAGYVLPKSLIKKVIPQLEDLTKGKTEENLFYIPVQNMPDILTEREKKQIIESYTTTLELKIIPAIERLNEYIKTEYKEAGRTSSGIDMIPEGKEYYKYLIRYYTTTNMTADEIHELGLKEVERIASEMEKIKNEVGFEGSLKEFFNHVRSKKELMPFKEPQEVIDNFYAIHERMKSNLENMFDLTPKTDFEVRRTEEFREASASAEYNPGSLDGTRAGIFYVPIPDVKSYNLFSDEDLFLHEAIPGHHYQISLQQENTQLPEFRKTIWYSAYGEGWALYAESLGKQLGLYTDPYQYFGMLSAEMHRAIRLVVDTGLHSKGWTREQAIQYSLDNEAEGEASIISEIERYMAIPGQALSYKIGQLKILELRELAKKDLGSKFDIKTFHNKVLESGCIPLQLLETKIKKWISKQKSE